MKQRNVGLMILWGFLTFGIYDIVWNYKFQSEVREETGKGIMPWGHILISLVPLLNICYWLYWIFTIDKRLEFMGARKGNLGILYVLLSITIVGYVFVPAILQNKANNLSTIEVSQKDKTQTELRVDKYAKYFNK